MRSIIFMILFYRQILTKINIHSRQFHIKIHTENIIGLYYIDVISVLLGCLLGDAHSYKSKSNITGRSFRFC